MGRGLILPHRLNTLGLWPVGPNCLQGDLLPRGPRGNHQCTDQEPGAEPRIGADESDQPNAEPHRRADESDQPKERRYPGTIRIVVEPVWLV